MSIDKSKLPKIAHYPKMSTIFSKIVCKHCLHACNFFHVCWKSGHRTADLDLGSLNHTFFVDSNYRPWQFHDQILKLITLACYTRKSWVWHWLAKLNNLNAALLRQALSLRVTLSWKVGCQKHCQKLSNKKHRKLGF